MYIDIYDYVDRYLINYIVYHSQHLRDYGDVERAASWFDGRYYEQIEKIVGVDIYDIMEADLIAGDKAAGPLLVVDALQNGSELNDIIDIIGWGINEGLDASAGRVDWENYEAFIQAGKSFSNLSNTESLNLSSRLHEFFNLILAAMQEANLLSVEVLNALTNIGSRLTGTQFKIAKHWSKEVIPLSGEDQNIARSVITSLNNATAKFGAGTLTPRSFAVTITNIFTKAIGTKYYDTIIANGLAAAQQQCDSVLNQLVASGNLKWINKGGQTLPTASSTRTNIVSSPLLSLAVIQNGQEYEIEVANSTDITWPTRDMSRSGIIKLIGKSKVGEMFSGQPEQYWAYNIIAHRGVGADFNEAFSRIRAYAAASFFVGWINGNNFKTGTGKKAQYLFVNGRIYPVHRIISNICNEIMMNGAENVVSIDGVGRQRNSWVGSYANIADALTRSEMVNKVINTLTIAATLNTNILTQYAY